MIWVLLACFAVVLVWLGLGIWKDLQKSSDIFEPEDEEL